MTNKEIVELQRVFVTRLDALNHILDVGERHCGNLEPALQERLAPDMYPLGSQIVFACNPPRSFAQWCAGHPIENLAREVSTAALARAHISETRKLVVGIEASDSKLDEIKRVGLGSGRHCELPGRLYVSDYVLPNFYFHITTTYAILRKLGVPVGKADFMPYLGPYVKTGNPA